MFWKRGKGKDETWLKNMFEKINATIGKVPPRVRHYEEGEPHTRLLRNINRLIEGAIYAEAIKELKKVLESDLFDYEGWNQLGICYKELKRFKEAETAYRISIRINPNFSASHANLGILCKSVQRFEEAVTELKKSIELQPDNFRSYYSLGDAYLQMKRFDEAIEAFKSGIAINANYAQFYYGLGLAYSSIHLWEEARTALQEAVRLDPTDPDYREELGRVERQCQR